MIRYQDKQQSNQKNYLYQIPNYKISYQPKSYSFIHSKKIIPHQSHRLSYIQQKKINSEKNRNIQKTYQLNQQKRYDKTKILKTKFLNQESTKQKILNQEKPFNINVNAKNKYVKLRQEYKFSILQKDDFKRLQQIRKENQKKMMQLGLQPRRIYQTFYKGNEKDKPLENFQCKSSLIQQREKGLQKCSSRNSFMNDRYSKYKENSSNMTINSQSNMLINKDSFYNKNINAQFNKVNNTRQNQIYNKYFLPQFKKQTTKLKHCNSKNAEDFKHNVFDRQNIHSSHSYTKERAFKQLKNQLKDNIQKFNINQSFNHNIDNYQNNNSFKMTNNKLIQKNRLDDPRIHSIDRITCKIKTLLNSIQRPKNVSQQMFKQQRLSFNNEKINQNSYFKFERQKNSLQERKTFNDNRTFLGLVKQQPQNLKKKQNQKQQNLNQWKKNIKKCTKPPLKPFVEDNKHWDNDIHRIQQKIKKVQQQKFKLQKQSVQNKSNSSRLALQISTNSNSSKKIDRFKSQQKAQTILAQLFKNQIQLDSKLRQSKKHFNLLNNPDKWNILKQLLNNKGFKKYSQQDIHIIFTSTFQQSNPFNQQIIQNFEIDTLKNDYYIAEQNFLKNVKGSNEKQKLYQMKTNFTKKQNLIVQDLVRFVNMQLNTYYRNRDLILLYRRFNQKELSFSKFVQVLSKNSQ